MDELPQTAIGALRLLASTQVQVDVMSDQLIQAVKEGEVNPLEVLVQLKAIEKVSDRVKKEIQENALNAADKFPGTSFDFNGNKIEKAELGVKYDYLSTNDPIYERLLKVLEEAKTQVSEREAFLKAVKAPFSLLDESTGEVSIITPPNRKSTTGLRIQLR